MNYNFTFSDLGSLATFFLLLFTIWQYKKDAKRKLDMEEKSQAEKISSWIVLKSEGERAFIAVSNQSRSPVYEVILLMVPFQGAGDPTGKNIPDEYRAFLSVVPPGKYYSKIGDGWGGMSFHPSSSVAFIDASGTNWVREGDGRLHKIDLKPMEYYNIPRPISWGHPLDEPKSW